jgi:hypothetical protein
MNVQKFSRLQSSVPVISHKDFYKSYCQCMMHAIKWYLVDLAAAGRLFFDG